ncbi:MAG TPA: ATP synthase F1 subunit epsilon [Candidatus Sumerlaeota bacterium]|nr:ATP synthase F1 subunit epsilon [Candidatus Sumerlaeota bacterium]
MAEAEYRLQIVTQQKTVFNQMISSATLPGEEGSFGVWANHAPIIAVLKEGPVEIRRGSNVQRVQITGGFFEMESNKATLLADSLTGLVENQEEN